MPTRQDNLNIQIGDKRISYHDEVFVIAEAGVNHNGRLNLALKLVDAAAQAGAHAVKFQTFKAHQVVVKKTPMAEYQKKNIARKQSQLAMLKKVELQEAFYDKIIKHCKRRKIIFLSTPHGGFESIDFLHSLDVPAYKFGSGDLNNTPVLQYAARFGKPMILGTGMSTLQEVKNAIAVIRKTGNNKIIVLHATTNYPCPPQEVNLQSMVTMMHAVRCLVGYSDHTLGIETSSAAVALKACMIEKHFTLNKKLPGPDHKCSAEPKELQTLIDRIRYIHTILGSPVKQPNPSELRMLKTVRKSIVTLSEIKKDEFFTPKNLGIKRPGTGLDPKYYYRIIGKKALQNIRPDVLLTKKHYAE